MRYMTQDWKRLRDSDQSLKGLPLSLSNVKRLLIRALETGNIEITGHMKRRCGEREFTTVDAENVIRTGTICSKAQFDPEFENYRITVRGRIEGRILEIQVGLDPSVDYDTPLVTFITGTRKGETDDEGGDDRQGHKDRLSEM